jgi:iron complex transport system substrate-binding protein
MPSRSPLRTDYRSGLRALVVLWLGCFSLGSALAAAASPEEARPPVERVVSLNPSLTAILLELGAGDVLVGVDDVSAAGEERVATLPRVGGLFNPSLEAVLALEPQVVVLVPSVEQRDFRTRLETLGVRVVEFENTSFAQVIDNVGMLGRLVGREREASQRTDSIARTRRAVAAVAGRHPSPRCVLVLQRDPLYIVGSGSFLDEMLAATGVRNVAAEFVEPYPMVSVEWLVGAGPEVILDSSLDSRAQGFWARWPSLPAVRNGRVVEITPGVVTLPGPRLDDSLLLLLGAVHGAAARDEARALAAEGAESTPPAPLEGPS